MMTEIKSKVYVVTRNSRRIEERKFFKKEEAEVRAQKLVDVTKNMERS